MFLVSIALTVMTPMLVLVMMGVLALKLLSLSRPKLLPLLLLRGSLHRCLRPRDGRQVGRRRDCALCLRDVDRRFPAIVPHEDLAGGGG